MEFEFDEVEMMPGPVSELLDALSATGAVGEDDTFTTVSPMWGNGNRTFGGVVVSQALSAAMRTVPDGLDVHSLHGYFLRPSQPGSEATHRVERLRDGRSFTNREVTTLVEGRPTFRLACSFHAAEKGDEYQLPMRDDVPRPEDIEGFEAPFPFDIREVGATPKRSDGTYESTRRFWFRTRERLPDDPAVHACVLAYISDMTGAAFRPRSLGRWGTHTDASLDHSLWFHRPRRADEWNYYDMTAQVNAGGRATMRGTMYGDDGVLYQSMAQELLIRELEVPMVYEPPPWASKDHPEDDGVSEGEGDGAA